MKRAHALAGAAALLAFVAVVAPSSFAPQRTAAPAPASTSPPGDMAMVPGAANNRFFRELGSSLPGPQIEISLTDTKQLITDGALRAIMDSYLLGRSDESRLPALRDYLVGRLPPAAAQDALQLAERYSAYLAQHDALLAAQNFPETPDPVRLAGWQQQRRQLRIRLLGERVTEEWFGAEDTYLQQALAEATQPQVGPASEAEEAQHRAHMQQVLRDAASRAAPVPYPAAPMAN
ncbi:lipase chaperone protein [Duganella sp. CF402]|uniref:lipase secretion chaperone n=1 Tax=unclassified Duganella TaxID=2636909 RepID=UPI0008D632EF|nr:MULTISPECIES: lipase secretion chaperone [unclassified Duganella]RZT10712.1 lipase chaperone protein [Duganella sp. BK701]SEL00691.1 lipase chaperone protein [Duganella sp. CF402]